jgi:DNA-binding transcriptional regulator YiaG
MTPTDFRTIRNEAALTQSGLAARLRVTLRAVQQWESGERNVSGPVSLLMELLREGKLE